MSYPAPEECFVIGDLQNAVGILDIPSENQSQDGDNKTQLFNNAADLAKYLGDEKRRAYSCRFISICQRNSWRPLQVTSQMLSLLIEEHGFSPHVRDLASCFYKKNLDLEDSFCMPFTLSADGPWVEFQYTLRYPEFKEEEAEWSIRQTAICHRINSQTRQSIIILISPKAKSKAYENILEHLTTESNRFTGNTWFGLHDVLINTQIHAWRGFNKSCEAEFLPISNTTFATYIDEPLRVGYDQLSSLSSLHARFIKIISLVASTSDLLDEIIGFLGSFPDVVNDHRRQNALLNSFRNHRRSCTSYSRSAEFLKDRVVAATQLLANTLSLRDQVLANEQNGNMLQLNKSAVFITTLTLIYAPASYVASFFGMNFFAMDQPNSRIVGTTMIWIYILVTFMFTLVTVIFYYWLLRHDGVLFGRLAPKVPVNNDWRGFMRRFTKLEEAKEK